MISRCTRAIVWKEGQKGCTLPIRLTSFQRMIQSLHPRQIGFGELRICISVTTAEMISQTLRGFQCTHSENFSSHATLVLWGLLAQSSVGGASGWNSLTQISGLHVPMWMAIVLTLLFVHLAVIVVYHVTLATWTFQRSLTTRRYWWDGDCGSGCLVCVTYSNGLLKHFSIPLLTYTLLYSCFLLTNVCDSLYSRGELCMQPSLMEQSQRWEKPFLRAKPGRGDWALVRRKARWVLRPWVFLVGGCR